MRLLTLIILCMAVYSCSPTRKNISNSNEHPAKRDSSREISALKAYKEIITNKAITSKGLFTIHQIGTKFYFEITDSLLNHDILTVNRIKKGAAEGRIADWGTAGDLIGSNIIQFTKEQNNKIFIRRISYYDRSVDSSENGMYRNVQNSNVQAIVANFDIKTISKDSTSYVIDVTDYLNSENDVFFFRVPLKKALGILGTYQPARSFIKKIESFSHNVEIHTVKTYSKDDESDLTFTLELNSSIILLPAQKMTARYADPRVGYFSEAYRNFDDTQGVNPDYIITRWRLEPKKEDIDRYMKGELVEPKKPIIFYIDPTTPKKWIPYLIQAVNDWQIAFEAAGFKNAIMGRIAPADDPNWSIDDAEHSVIVYKPSHVQNASGPHIHDPRTGEILESHINIHENVMQLVHDWYFVQAAAIDPNARKIIYDDSLMGSLLRYVCSHEVGHTLGLLHNFGASASVPVEKLRDKAWVESNGICPSIMDYARFNYVAQPEDHISSKGMMSKIGDYDKWAIEWGYRWFPDQRTEKDDKEFMSKWISEKTSQNKRLWFGNELRTYDPRCQSQDLGDDAVKAGDYGINNLKRITTHLLDWTKQPENDYDIVSRLNNEIFMQYQRYIYHVTRNVGNIYFNQKTTAQTGPLWQFIDKEHQQNAIKFLQNQLFTTPNWLINETIFSKVAGSGFFGIVDLQGKVLKNLLSLETFSSLLWFQTNYPEKAYTPDQFLEDLESGIWKELDTRRTIDIYRRNLQKAYCDQIIELLNSKNYESVYHIYSYTDLPSLAKAHAQLIIGKINRSINYYNDASTIRHLIDIRDNLKKSLNPGVQTYSIMDIKTKLVNTKKIHDCWENDVETEYLPSFFR